MRRSPIAIPILLSALVALAVPCAAVAAQPLSHRVDAISGGAEALDLAKRMEDISQLEGSPVQGLDMKAFVPGVGFLAYNFDDNSTETGFLFIPPDPIGAAGPDRLISVVNVGIECRNKTGTLLWLAEASSRDRA